MRYIFHPSCTYIFAGVGIGIGSRSDSGSGNGRSEHIPCLTLVQQFLSTLVFEMLNMHLPPTWKPMLELELVKFDYSGRNIHVIA